MIQQKITGEEIIDAMLGNLREGLEPLRYSVVAPSVYHVYLHEQDYGRLQGIFPRIQQEARQALTEELQLLEQADRGTGLAALVQSKLKGRLPKWMQEALPNTEERKRDYQAPAEGWQIAFHQDADGALQPGDIAIHSLLNLPQRIEMGEGLTTKTIKTLRRDGQLSHQESYSTTEELKPRAVSKTTDDPLATNKSPDSAAKTEILYASIRYSDDAGVHVYEMLKEQIVIGRGGEGYWVDIALQSSGKVSREHLRLRYDGASRKFYLKDVSSYGTTINGGSMPSSMQEINGERRDINREVELPVRARIVLAGMVALDFEASSATGG
jgi:pSer/pThr/pTyr-binding forkhead associated (FHA) protein